MPGADSRGGSGNGGDGGDARTYTFKTSGTCSTKISFQVEDGALRNIRFTNGCDGNLKGISLLAEGADAHVIADRLRGVRCGRKQTSCPDQLAQAIDKALAN